MQYFLSPSSIRPFLLLSYPLLSFLSPIPLSLPPLFSLLPAKRALQLIKTIKKKKKENNKLLVLDPLLGLLYKK